MGLDLYTCSKCNEARTEHFGNITCEGCNNTICEICIDYKNLKMCWQDKDVENVEIAKEKCKRVNYDCKSCNNKYYTINETDEEKEKCDECFYLCRGCLFLDNCGCVYDNESKERLKIIISELDKILIKKGKKIFELYTELKDYIKN